MGGSYSLVGSNLEKKCPGGYGRIGEIAYTTGRYGQIGVYMPGVNMWILELIEMIHYSN